MKRRHLAEKYCPVARAGAQFVDSWTFIILREIFLGNARFSGLQKQSGMSPRSLTLRLRKLEEEGILAAGLGRGYSGKGVCAHAQGARFVADIDHPEAMGRGMVRPLGG